MKKHGLPLKGAAGRRIVATILEPVHERVDWKPRAARRGEYRFAFGLRLVGEFPGETATLETAREDFRQFFQVQGLGEDQAAPCRMVWGRSLSAEEHEIKVSNDGVEIRAGDTEGVRRALYWIEDEMLKRGGPFLPGGTHRRHPVIKTRISRCFFGPINRPPGNRDELLDDVNYYPDPYLNRLAHDGVNVLWITIKFRDTVPSRLFPEFAPDSSKRLARLRDTVERCGRYGIRVFVFCIEPDSLPVDSPLFVRHPELKGHVIDFRAAFCTATKLGKDYLAEAARTLFTEVPHLGGMIVIPVGERFTQCSSIALPESGTTDERCNCPRCARRSPHTVLRETLAAMRRGMNSVNPAAELISWPYGQSIMWGEQMTIESAAHLPKGVILQHNFETGGSVRQLGRDRPLIDYWLSVVGPSPVFRAAAQTAKARGIRMSAKLQVGCSHEDATVPFVPVPGILHSKYALLHKLGVSAVMQSWYFGNYPSLMTRAAGALSFAPFVTSEEEFLVDLAARDWGTQARLVAGVWKHFRRAYEHYPATHLFGYYGPVQDGLVWPLHLIPRNRPLAPTWKLGYPPSGDYLADCLSSGFTLDEVVTLCVRMAEGWKRGLDLLKKAFDISATTSAQRREWHVASAIGLQFESAAEILQFYQLREKLAGTTGPEAVAILADMREIVRREIARRRQMIALCGKEATLGFHSEAEGFKFTPALLRRGISSLEQLLKKEFPRVRREASRGNALFPAYTGSGTRRRLIFRHDTPLDDSTPTNTLAHFITQNSTIPGKPIPGTDWRRSANAPIRAHFRTGASSDSLLITLVARSKSSVLRPDGHWISSVVIDVEPRRLHPRLQFSADTRGHKASLIDDGYLMKEQLDFDVRWRFEPEGWTADVAIPRQSAHLRDGVDAFRFNIRVVAFNKETDERMELSWAARSPLKSRQAWDDANPATDYQWAGLQTEASRS